MFNFIEKCLSILIVWFQVPGVLAAVDATKEPLIASKFNVKGYPTILYFSYGDKMFDVNVREATKIVDFMRFI